MGSLAAGASSFTADGQDGLLKLLEVGQIVISHRLPEHAETGAPPLLMDADPIPGSLRYPMQERQVRGAKGVEGCQQHGQGRFGQRVPPVLIGADEGGLIVGQNCAARNP